MWCVCFVCRLPGATLGLSPVGLPCLLANMNSELSLRVSTCLPLGPRVLGGMMTASPLGSVGPEAGPCGIAGSSGALALAERSELGRVRSAR